MNRKLVEFIARRFRLNNLDFVNNPYNKFSKSKIFDKTEIIKRCTYLSKLV